MFQRCEVPLVWWPWWPFNAADVFMGSLLPLERMLREGAISNQIRLVPVLDGLWIPKFYHWWFLPFFKREVRQYLSDVCTINSALWWTLLAYCELNLDAAGESLLQQFASCTAE